MLHAFFGAICGAPSAPAEPDVVTFTISGTAFSPQLALNSGATVMWESDGATIVGGATAEPDLTWVGAGPHTVTATVSSGGIRGINVGYAADDGGNVWDAEEGNEAIDVWPAQPVTAVTGIAGLTSLEWFACSRAPIVELDFSGCSNLERIENYNTPGETRGALTTLDVSGTALRRFCIEYAELGHVFDARPMAATIEDWRGAYATPLGITFPSVSMPNLWHICVRENPAIVSIPFALMPNLREALLNNVGLTGALDLSQMTAALGQCVVWLNGNQLTSLTLGTGTYLLTAVGCGFSQAVVDGLLDQLAGFGVGWSVDLKFNAAPSAAGYADVEAMLGAGWHSVEVDEPQASTVPSLEFGRTLYGTDYATRSPAPTVGTIYSMWTRIIDPGTAPWHHANMDVLVVYGDNWSFRCLGGNSDVAENGTARYNANSMLFVPDPYTWCGDFSYYDSGYTLDEATVTGWVWLAWQVIVGASSFTIRQWVRLGETGDVFAAGESVIPFADVRAELIGNGWSEADANAWTPSGQTSFQVGSDNGYLSRARVHTLGVAPTLEFLQGVSDADGPVAGAWADYPLWWDADVPGPVLTDRSGNGRNLTLASGGALYSGLNGPEL